MRRGGRACYLPRMADAPAAHAAIVTTGLTKQYGPTRALDDLRMQVEAGTIFGFLGPNGAGKTTTIRLLLGFIAPTAGSAAIFGHDVWRDGVAARARVGFLVQSEAFYPEMSGRSQLDLAARLSGGPATLRDRLLDLLDLSRHDLDRRAGEYSKGMKQKLALTAAIQHDPELLILDEPTDGLDPLIQRRFETFLREFNAAGRTIFMSSHDLGEVERVCVEVAIVRDGVLVGRESIERLRHVQMRDVEAIFADTVPEALKTLRGARIDSLDGRRVAMTIEGDLSELLDILASAEVESLVIMPPTLDDLFMSFYGMGTRGERA
jgi:ABC-2 type transport system ATP-binding protein